MNWKQHEKVMLRKSGFKKIADSLEPEYQLARSVILARIKKGLTQKQLANKAKTSQSAIARVESGYYLPSLSFLKKISEALQTKLDICLH